MQMDNDNSEKKKRQLTIVFLKGTTYINTCGGDQIYYESMKIR